MKNVLVIIVLVSGFLIVNAQTNIPENLLGCWNMQKSMDVTKSGESLQLNRDSLFVFTDYNDKLQDYEKLSGTWEQQAEKIILVFPGRPKQTFMLKKEKNGKLALTRDGGYNLVKADPSDCQ